MYAATPMLIPGEFPMQCTCPNCKQQIVTRTEKQNGLLTWLLVGGLCLIGCWLGCCLIPLCVDACKVRHSQFSSQEIIDFVCRIRLIFVQVVRLRWVLKKASDLAEQHD